MKTTVFLLICFVSMLLTEAAKLVELTGKRTNPIVNDNRNNFLLINGGRKSHLSSKKIKVRRKNKNTRRQKRRGPTFKKRLEDVAVQSHSVYKDMVRRAKVVLDILFMCASF